MEENDHEEYYAPIDLFRDLFCRSENASNYMAHRAAIPV
jgi:hypothetical protein